MRVGLALPQFGGVAHRPEGVARFAGQAEDLGADSLWVGDRLLAPVSPTVGYGMRGPGPFPVQFRSVLDPFALLTVAATVTERVRLGTNVINATWYPPALLARSLTAIDVISGGRLVAGLGVGWSPDEYQAVGVPWPGRGPRLEETLDVLEALWTTNPAEHHGPLWTIPATHVDLTPVQRPRPPIYLAGSVPAALRRIGRRGDGWLPVSVPPAPVRPARYTEPLAAIRQAAAEAGRDPARIGAILRVYPTAEATLGDIIEHLATIERETGIQDAFVDLLYLAPDMDDLLKLSADLLTMLRR